MKRIYTILVLALLFSSCLTLQEEPVRQPAVWQYEIEITDPGTRSEGKIGHLLYNGTEVPFLFDQIFVDGRLYSFHYKTNPWDFGGYQCDDIPVHFHTDMNMKIVENEINQGWYLTENLQKKVLTPEYWIWIKRDTIEAFLDPNRIDSFIQAFDLKVIKPDSIREIQSDTHLKKDTP
jgi:hypothetical protein